MIYVRDGKEHAIPHDPSNPLAVAEGGVQDSEAVSGLRGKSDESAVPMHCRQMAA